MKKTLLIFYSLIIPFLVFGQNKTKTILLYSGWQTSNIGDVGHTPGTLATLEKYIPEANVILWARTMNDAKKAMLMKRFPNLEIVYGNTTDMVKPEGETLKNAIKKADIFIWNSGMHFNFGVFGKDYNVVANMLFPLNYCIEQGIPFGIYGHSFDKFEDYSHLAFRPTLDKAAFIYCRDSESLKFIKQLGFQCPVMDFVPDAVFGIDVKDNDKANVFLKENGLKAGKFLAYIPRTNTPKINAQTGKGDLLNPLTISGELMAENELWMQKTRDIISWWVRTTKMKVLLSPEMDKEIKYSKEWIYDKLDVDVQKMVVWRSTFWTVEEANAIYAQAHTVFGIEPHSLIMAMTSGVPVVHMRAQKHGKKAYMFSDLGLGEWLFDIDKDEASMAIGALKSIVDNYSQSRKKVEEAMVKVRKSQESAMNEIRKKIGL